jgi:hypothetical protein
MEQQQTAHLLREENQDLERAISGVRASICNVQKRSSSFISISDDEREDIRVAVSKRKKS